MGMFDTIKISEDVELPHFPESLDKTNIDWQSKRGLSAIGDTYRITSDGRLERKERDRREKTTAEKQAEAAKWGYKSWDKYVEAYDYIHETGSMYPEEIDYDPDEDGYEDMPPTFRPSESKVASTYWADHDMHGSFEFHSYINEDREVFPMYEARFFKGDLEDIVLLGGRGEDSLEETIEKMEAIDEH